MGQIDSALITYTDAIAVFQNNNMIQSLIISYNALGQLYAIKGDSVLAQQSFLLALQFAKQLNNKVYLQNSYDNLAHLLQKTEPEEAINFLLKANELRKELFEEETQKHIKRFNIEYETREKQLKIDMLEQSLNKSNIIKIGLFVSFILLFLVVLLLAIYIIIRRKYTRELENMNHVKNRYFSILSHDLKNPIIGQRNLLKSTVNYYETIPTSEHKEIVP